MVYIHGLTCDGDCAPRRRDDRRRHDDRRGRHGEALGGKGGMGLWMDWGGKTRGATMTGTDAL